MIETLGIVEPRIGAGRGGNRFARKLGSKSWLEWVVHRAVDSIRLDRVVVILGSGPDDRTIADLVPPHVHVLLDGAVDPLGRFIAALDRCPARAVVRICADNPFVDPALIDRLISTADDNPDCDYVSYCSRDGRPAVLSTLGIFAEWCRADSLRQADREATNATDRQQVTRYLYSRPEKFRVRLITMPSRLDRDDVRLTVDSEEDWEHAETIYEALGPERLEWQNIAALLEAHPALRERMRLLNEASAGP